MRGNTSASMHASRTSKALDKDEYYTLYKDIAEELDHYKDQFRGKHIICPCDWDESLDEVCVYASEEEVNGGTLFANGAVKTIDVKRTGNHLERDIDVIKCNFIKYLVSQAEDWGIASVSVSGYNPFTGEGVRFQDLDYSKYDLCVTNPPFSQFAEFVEVMFNNNMQFIVIGPQNDVSVKSVFLHIKNNQLWMGYNYHLSGFIRPDGTVLDKQHNIPRSCCWFTNMEVSYRLNFHQTDAEYNPEDYPKYDNFDAIEVSHSKDIPMDYDGVMGVPITFLQKYCPEQFEILGLSQVGCNGEVHDTKKYNDYREMRSATDLPTGSSGSKTNENAVMPGKGKNKTYYKGPNGEIVHPIYKRFFIRKKI